MSSRKLESPDGQGEGLLRVVALGMAVWGAAGRWSRRRFSKSTLVGTSCGNAATCA